MKIPAPALLAFSLALTLPAPSQAAGPTAQPLSLAAIPSGLTVLNEAVAARVEQDGSLFIAAPGKTNLFNNPNGQSAVHNAPMALFEPAGDFVLMARVTGKLTNVYDVAALVVYQDASIWAKLCYENSVAKEPTIVSVVTRGVSDDCNSQTINADHAYLAITRQGSVFTFHSSPDGKAWRMVRHFNLATTGKLKAGFAVHGSRGDGFSAVFSQITYIAHAPEKLGELPAMGN